MHMLRKLLGGLAAALLVPILLFEEWGWEPLARAAAQLARLPLWARFERGLRSLPPWAALLAFFVPMLMLFPIKLLGLFLLGEGHGMSALLLLLAAKVVGTAVVARLFQLLEPTLMRIPLFARWYPRWKAWKDRLLATVRQSAAWRATRRLKNGVRRGWRHWRNRRGNV
jgi:hypothetical protein